MTDKTADNRPPAPEFSAEPAAAPKVFENAPKDLGREPGAAPARGPKDRLDRWQRRLLDLSLRNSLLNYRQVNNRRYVEIIASQPGELEDRLAEGERFKLLGGLDLIKGDPENQPAYQTAELLARLAAAQKGSLVAPLEQKELEARLTALYRAARAALEEGGANTLFLACGFLSWKPEGRGKPCLAPLLLIPVRLERRSVQGGFTLALGDDEPRFNTTLLELLRKDYAIFELDALARELPADDHGLDVEGIWRAAREAVKNQPGWEVSPTVGLGLFSFAKFLMWKDLAGQAEILKGHPVIAHLLGQSGAFPDEPAFVEPRELDAKLEPQDVYAPLLADSSQLAAIASAAKGKDFVLLGPPGTGKSQTIANMIAQCLAEKKTVLFVAEKAAALNVVHRRLKSIGLGDFCLELHSSKSNKAEVLGQLSRACKSVAETDDDWRQAAARLLRAREQLNGYVEQLHRVYPNGLNAYHALGTVIRERARPEIPLSWPGPEYHDRAAYEALFEAARRIKNQGPQGKALAETPLRHIGRGTWSPLWEQGLFESVEALREAGGRVRQGASACPPVFAEAENGDLEALAQLAELLLSAHGRDWLFALAPEADKLVGRLQEAAALLEAYQGQWAALSLAYPPAALEADIAGLRAAWDQGLRAWWPKGFFIRRKVKKALQALAATTAEPDCGGDLEALRQLRLLKERINSLEKLSADSAGLFAGLATDRRALNAALTFAEGLRRSLGRLAASPERLLAVSAELEQLLGPGNILLAGENSVGRALSAFVEAVRHYESAAGTLKNFMETDLDLFRRPAAEAMSLCAGLVGQKQHVNAWCSWRQVCAEAAGLGLAPLVEAVTRGDIDPGEAEPALRANYARWWVVQVVEALDGLRNFTAPEHERVIAVFKELDETLRGLTCARISGRLRASDLLAGREPAEWRVLQRECAKKKRHLPVRRLIESLPTLLPQLTPCLLMSPLSIAQYLAAGKMVFDLVIFDEASQIPVWDAIGAMARGRKVIVVGDSKQLPPTNFFTKTEEAEADDDDLPDDDLESILEECLGAGLPSVPLSWHYRSRRESLITFSNRRYYNGELVTFPSPDTEDTAVSFCFAGGVYERGSSRTNPVEARALVDELLSRLRSPEFQNAAHPSIGVVTFNSQQQTFIEDLLDAERRNDPGLERFFDPELEEPVLVKNLESIQGDERDIMYFSIGFGPDQAGQMTMNFGALNKDGGERRLNVAVTRARCELKVFCSLHPDQISLAQTKARGVHDLRLFLEYARSGVRALSAEARENGEASESTFELAVAEALEKRGWRVTPEVGASAFRVDLGVADPDNPGAYLAGLECDGPTYRRSATARDRDRLRESVLRGLGWDILRLWSREWWLNAEAAADRLHQRLTALLERKRRTNPPAPPAEPPVKTAESPAEAPAPEMPDDAAELIEREHLRAIVQSVVAWASPVHENVLCALVAKQLGLARAGSKIRSGVMSMAAELFEQSKEDVGIFFWKKGDSPAACSAFRERGENETCAVDEIALPELVALARSLKVGYGEDPIVVLARRLGLSRLRAAARPRLEKAWALSRKSAVPKGR